MELRGPRWGGVGAAPTAVATCYAASAAIGAPSAGGCLRATRPCPSRGPALRSPSGTLRRRSRVTWCNRAASMSASWLAPVGVPASTPPLTSYPALPGLPSTTPASAPGAPKAMAASSASTRPSLRSAPAPHSLTLRCHASRSFAPISRASPSTTTTTAAPPGAVPKAARPPRYWVLPICGPSDCRDEPYRHYISERGHASAR